MPRRRALADIVATPVAHGVRAMLRESLITLLSAVVMTVVSIMVGMSGLGPSTGVLENPSVLAELLGIPTSL